jgi:hypothetical protein
MRAGSMVVVDVPGKDSTQMAFFEDHDVVETLAANEPITRSTYPFSQGERKALRTCVIAVAST